MPPDPASPLRAVPANHTSLQFSANWSELCLVASQDSVRKDTSESSYLLGHKLGTTQSLPYANWEYEFSGKNVTSSIPPIFYFILF